MNALLLHFTFSMIGLYFPIYGLLIVVDILWSFLLVCKIWARLIMYDFLQLVKRSDFLLKSVMKFHAPKWQTPALTWYCLPEAVSPSSLTLSHCPMFLCELSGELTNKREVSGPLGYNCKDGNDREDDICE